MRKVFLDELPRWEDGVNKGKINWSECVGYKVPFIYEDLSGEIEIVGYSSKGSRVIVEYNENTIELFSGSFKECNLGRLFNKITKDFKVEIGQVFQDGKRDIVIIDRGYKTDRNKTRIRSYKYKCNVCGFDCGEHYKNGEFKEGLWITEYHLKEGNGCACCANQIAVLGINTIWDTARWMIELGVDECNAKRYARSSNKKINVICSDCGKEKRMTINNLYNRKSISCICGDKRSYPEKFLTSALRQLQISFTREYLLKGSGQQRYDFYIPGLNMIIEVHGRQHYEEVNWRKNGGRTLANEQENDRAKEELALTNGIDRYIVIDCRYSEVDWIKESIMNSELAELLDLSNIDWVKCEEFALKNIVKEVCNYWNNKEEWETTVTIANNNAWGIKSSGTIVEYLKKGNKLGWCNYDSKKEARRALKRYIELNKSPKIKPIEIFKDELLLGRFESAAELERQSEEKFGVKLSRSKICLVCKGKRKYHKGFTFKYVEDIE